MCVRPSVSANAHKQLSSAMCAIAEVGVDVGAVMSSSATRLSNFVGANDIFNGVSGHFNLHCKGLWELCSLCCVLQLPLVECTQQIVSALQIYKLEHKKITWIHGPPMT